MKVVRKDNGKPFDMVDVGEVFMHNGCCYMKTNQQDETVYCRMKAVNLETGEMAYFASDRTVKMIDAYIVIE